MDQAHSEHTVTLSFVKTSTSNTFKGRQPVPWKAVNPVLTGAAKVPRHGLVLGRAHVRVRDGRSHIKSFPLDIKPAESK